MKCAVEMGSVAMIYIPSFMKIGSDIQNLIGSIHRHRSRRKHKPNLGKKLKILSRAA
jgi:hypothetical protein